MKNNIPKTPPVEDNHAFSTIGFKVSPESRVLIEKLCKKRGIGPLYRLGQMMFDCAVRYMSDQHNLTPDLQKMMRVFEYFNGWRNALNLTDPAVNRVICEAIYFIYDGDGHKKGVRAVHVKRPFHGDWQQNYNVQEMLDTFIRLVFPHRYPQLMALAHECDCNSILELLDYTVDYFTKMQDEIELARPFEDAARAENGREIRYGDRTKRKLRVSMENMYAQYEREHNNNNYNNNENEKEE